MLYELKDEDYFKLWMYFEDRADKIKAAMLSMFTWLVGFKVALLSFIFANFANYDASKAKLELYVIVISAAFAGLAICWYSFSMLSESGHHIQRNWDRSKNFRKRVFRIDNILRGKNDKKEEKSIWKRIYDPPQPPLCRKDKLWSLLIKEIEIWDQLKVIAVLFGLAFFAIPVMYFFGAIAF
ncbi:hypothetical protein [Pseudanabaena sp. Chao 1811]|uniref:hypothetical protein n=1 Tax=Pseudanabaena sp. Chao 1811 TaxID=2963092 RepID=UPI0022F394B8|nr:hypothetical protein [Pseudanabaena sp. Chao 1811]